MKDILIAGIAGSGKGTQARALEEKFGEKIQYFEPWAILRSLSSNDNIIGDYAKSYTSKGRLLPDAFMKGILGLVFASLEEGNSLLVDGFPRLGSQKKIFDEAMQSAGRDFVVFHLIIDEEEAVKRLHARLMCPTCGTTYNTHLHGDMTICPEDGATLIRRTDDQSDEAIQQRFKAFHDDTEHLLEQYKQEGKLIEIDWTQSIEDITKEIILHLQ